MCVGILSLFWAELSFNAPGFVKDPAALRLGVGRVVLFAWRRCMKGICRINISALSFSLGLLVFLCPYLYTLRID